MVRYDKGDSDILFVQNLEQLQYSTTPKNLVVLSIAYDMYHGDLHFCAKRTLLRSAFLPYFKFSCHC